MKKLLPILLLLFLPSFGALNIMTWDGSASSNFNDTANWTGTVVSGNTLTAGDSCLMNAGSTAATVSASVAIGALMVTAGYTGTISLQSYTLTVSGAVVNLGGATLSAGTSTLSLTGAEAQTVTSAGETWYDVTINRATAGTCLFADAISCHTLTASATNTQVISWTGMTMTASGNITLNGTGTHIFGNGITMTGASGTLHIGSTLTAPTASGCIITFNGTTACILDDDKGTAFLSLTLGAGAKVTNTGDGGSTTVFIGPTTVWTFGANSTFTNNGWIALYATASQSIFGAGVTFDGNSPISISTAGANITITYPAVSYNGTGAWSLACGAVDVAPIHSLSGTFNIGANSLTISNSRVGITLTSNTNGNTITCGALSVGTNNATAVHNINYGASTISCVSYTGAVLNIGSCTESFSTSQWTCSGAWTFGSNHTIVPGTSIVNFTGAGTTTSNGKAFPGDLTINSTGLVRTFADKYKVNGNLLLTAGKPIFGLFRDTVVGNYTNSLTAAADTANRQDTLFLGGSMTRSAGSHTKNENAVTKLYGTSLCNLTTSGSRMNYIHIVGTNNTKQIKLLDNDTTIRLRDSIGTINQNGFALADSILYIGDSNQVLDGSRTIWKYLVFDTHYEANTINKITTFLGSAACSLVVNSTNTIGNITENLTGTGSLQQVGSAHIDTLNITDGSYKIRGGDTAFVAGNTTFNNTGDSVARSGTGTAYIVINSNFSTAAGVLWDTAHIKITSTLTGATIALNGNATLPPIQLNARSSLTGSGIINRLSFSTDGLKCIFEKAKKFTFTNVDTSYWNGDSMVSSQAFAACTLSWGGQNLHYSNMYWRDCKTKSPDTLKCPWSQGCRSGGGN